MKRWIWIAIATACADPAPPPRAEITVFAAASLTDALEEAANAFEATEATDVELSFAGSQVLARQIEQGAPADAFVAASRSHVEGTIAASLEAPAELICNAPVLVVPPSSAVRTFRDLPRAERVVLGTPEVPIGAYSDEILAGAARLYGAEFDTAVRGHIASRELDVRRVLGRVTEGDADAAIVYRSDAVFAGEAVRAIGIPPEIQVIARYPIAVVRRSDERAAARRFVRYLRSEPGQAILVRHGFTRCPQ